MTEIDFTDVTEMAGEKISHEQLLRLFNRYYWAEPFIRDKDVIEVACGTGPGLGYLALRAKSLRAGDCSPTMVERVRAHYGDRIDVREFDAADMPYEDNSADVILIYEALYYLPDPDAFMAECTRVLRPGGEVLVVTANKDLYDFTPSPYSRTYYGVVELNELMREHGYEARFWGFLDVAKVSVRQRVLRPVKALASRLNLIPKTMRGKTFLKRLVFGKMVDMPASIEDVSQPFHPPDVLSATQPDRRHKVIYCAAKKKER